MSCISMRRDDPRLRSHRLRKPVLAIPSGRPAMLVLAVGIAASCASAGAVAGEGIVDLIRLARRLNPEVAAAALEADAASARIASAGALDDPKFQIELITPRTDGGWPDKNPEEQAFRIRQMFPLAGKRALRRGIAEANGRQAQAQRLEVENQIAYRVKVTYAEYHLAHLAEEETRSLLATLDRLIALARTRYAQGLGAQEDVTGAEAERAALAAELVRVQTERHQARTRLNGLLARPPEIVLVEKPAPRPVPRLDALSLAALVERAGAESPTIRAQSAQIESAEQASRLADRGWYPDLEVSLGAVLREGRFEEYELMTEINIPLQTARLRAQQREAASMAGAARSRLDQLRLEVTTELHDAHAALVAAVRRRKILEEHALPQARIAVASAVRAYELARGEFASLLLLERALRETILAWLSAQFDEQVRIADIERLIGGEL